MLCASRRGAPLSRAVRANVNPNAILYTDDWQAYKPLKGEFIDHRVINHSAGLYVEGDVHTNTIEGFFGNLKTGMRGAYKKVLAALPPSPTSTSTPSATTPAMSAERCSSSYFFGLPAEGFLAIFLRFEKNSPRLGTLTS